MRVFKPRTFACRTFKQRTFAGLGETTTGPYKFKAATVFRAGGIRLGVTKK